VESEGRQTKQCLISYNKRKRKKSPFKNIFFFIIKVEDKSSEGAAGDGVTALKCPIAGGVTKPDQTAGNCRLFSFYNINYPSRGKSIS
jgi:hypothetical protein